MEFRNLGSKVRLTWTYKNAGAAEADPDVVVVVVKEPGTTGAGDSYTYGTDEEVVKDGTGIYHMDLDLSSCGQWAVRSYGTGTVQAGSADTLIQVRETVTD